MSETIIGIYCVNFGSITPILYFLLFFFFLEVAAPLKVRITCTVKSVPHINCPTVTLPNEQISLQRQVLWLCNNNSNNPFYPVKSSEIPLIFKL